MTDRINVAQPLYRFPAGTEPDYAKDLQRTSVHCIEVLPQPKASDEGSAIGEKGIIIHPGRFTGLEDRTKEPPFHQTLE